MAERIFEEAMAIASKAYPELANAVGLNDELQTYQSAAGVAQMLNTYINSDLREHVTGQILEGVYVGFNKRGNVSEVDILVANKGVEAFTNRVNIGSVYFQDYPSQPGIAGRRLLTVTNREGSWQARYSFDGLNIRKTKFLIEDGKRILIENEELLKKGEGDLALIDRIMDTISSKVGNKFSGIDNDYRKVSSQI